MIYEHFRPEERPFIAQVVDWIDQAERSHQPRLTDFLDPRQQEIVRSLVHRQPDVQVEFAGGYAQAERQRAIIAPHYRTLDDEQFALAVLSISSDDVRLAELDHGDYLGAILGLGLKRDKIGDIHVRPSGCHCIAAAETINYLNIHLRQVHRLNVWTEVLPIEELVVVEPDLEKMTFTVASLRLDAVVSEGLRLSRNKVLEPIRAGQCRLNWKIETNPAAQLAEGDMIALKGFGRFKLLEVGGKSRKDRIYVTIGKYI